MRSRLLLSTCIFLLIASGAFAEIKPGAFTLSPMAGGHVFEGDQGLEDSPFWFIGLGYNLTEKAALEAVWTYADADGDSSTDSDAEVHTFRLDALYHFTPEKKLVPYLAIGLGEIYSKYDQGGKRHHLLANAGGGLKYFFSESVALRGDIRYLLDFPEPKNNLQYSAGLIFQFGAPTPVPEPVEIAQIPPAPAAKSELAPAPVLPQDSDADGVNDESDICPGTPLGTQVDERGCLLDSDGDGVFDHLDKCPDTPAAVSVDQHGCTTKLSLQINFGHDSDRIGPEYDGEISKAAQCINDFPGNLVYIDGHTDSQGAAEYNQQLSQRRATAVKNRLIEKFNIPAQRMTARGFGEDMPVADNATAEGRFLNRRVDVVCGISE